MKILQYEVWKKNLEEFCREMKLRYHDFIRSDAFSMVIRDGELEGLSSVVDIRKAFKAECENILF